MDWRASLQREDRDRVLQWITQKIQIFLSTDSAKLQAVAEQIEQANYQSATSREEYIKNIADRVDVLEAKVKERQERQRQEEQRRRAATLAAAHVASHHGGPIASSTSKSLGPSDPALISLPSSTNLPSARRSIEVENPPMKNADLSAGLPTQQSLSRSSGPDVNESRSESASRGTRREPINPTAKEVAVRTVDERYRATSTTQAPGLETASSRKPAPPIAGAPHSGQEARAPGVGSASVSEPSPEVKAPLLRLREKYADRVFKNWSHILEMANHQKDEAKRERLLAKMRQCRELLRLPFEQLPKSLTQDHLKNVDELLNQVFVHLEAHFQKRASTGSSQQAGRISSVTSSAVSTAQVQGSNAGAVSVAPVNRGVKRELKVNPPEALQPPGKQGGDPSSNRSGEGTRPQLVASSTLNVGGHGSSTSSGGGSQNPDPGPKPSTFQVELTKSLARSQQSLATAQSALKNFEQKLHLHFKREKEQRLIDTIDKLEGPMDRKNTSNERAENIDPELYKIIRRECFRAQRADFLLVTGVMEGGLGALVIVCNILIPHTRLPTLFILVSKGYPKRSRPVVYFERPKLGWVGDLRRTKNLFDEKLSEAQRSGEGYLVSDTLTWWSKAASELSCSRNQLLWPSIVE
eukprot:CAMPEP_0184679892 /NCGR_PEP_ID=MMETSP0312-20130426/2767_1 /TAXON_ID=31354 /ORGANISM="Compsopogon coeruleus, Strain SAG 36.94" /LENGTH=637 /DNA_ID=CAMNT_0027129649 /DNA_START=377 /DNA_END=2290 /DNA_ORIENTATION=+